jgi:4-hydroxythreonine-4-phosphate dehydrogenase
MPHLILTPGDPTGIGPEITVKMLQRLNEFPNTQFTIIGSLKALNFSAAKLGLPLPQRANVDFQTIEDDLPGSIAFQALDSAVTKLARGEGDALVTGPISKRNLKAADRHFPGHTEILEELARQHYMTADCKAEMLFVHNNFRLMLLTRHCPLRDVSRLLSQHQHVESSISTLIGFLQHRLGINKPQLAILGINPHAGEINGDEEREIIIPLISELNDSGIVICDGPFAADAFFRGFRPDTSPFDAIIAAYHDQGLIPFKMLAGHNAVNITIGLPFIRTSVSHGTADDIAGKGIAKETSLIAAVHEATKIVNHTA